MIIFKRRKTKHKLYDISLARRRFASFFHSRPTLIDLKPLLSKKNRFWVLGLVFLAVVGMTYLVRSVLTRAEVDDFYPATCLGTWQKPELAQGEPEILTLSKGDTTDSYTLDNSSVLDSKPGEIFCGRFVPDKFETQGNINSVGLTLVWDIRGLNKQGEDEKQSEGGVDSNVGDKTSSSLPSSSSGGTSPQNVTSGPLFAPTSSDVFRDILITTTTESSSLDQIIAPSSGVQEVPAPSSSVSSSIIKSGGGVEGGPTSILRSWLFSRAEAEENAAVTTTPAVEIPATNSIETSSSVPHGEEIVPIRTAVTSTTSASEEIYVPPTEPSDDFLSVSYSLDGLEWIELVKVNPKNWQKLTTVLPLKSWEDIKKVQIRIKDIPTTLKKLPQVFLDGMFLEVQYDVPPIFKPGNLDVVSKEDKGEEQGIPTVILPQDKKPQAVGREGDDFAPNETPRFEFNLDNLPVPSSTPPISSSSSLNFEGDSPDFKVPFLASGINTPGRISLERELALNHVYDYKRSGESDFFLASFFRPTLDLLSRLGDYSSNFLNLDNKVLAQVGGGDQNVTPQEPIKAVIIGTDGHVSDIKPFLVVVNNKLQISVPEPERSFRPGAYKLRVWILKNNAVYFTEAGFNWGVLVVNFNESIYKKGDSAKIGIGVLDDLGRTICDAGVKVKVSTPSGKLLSFSTANGTIKRSNACGPETITNEPDYSSSLIADEVGNYDVTVIANTKNGVRQISDKFEVQKQPIFEVERLGPTRIFPPAMYEVPIKIKANQDFNGVIKEVVPLDFSILTRVTAKKTSQDNIQYISWTVNMKKGEEISINYFFDAPDVSPELYKLGPLTFSDASSTDQVLWQESRNWQVAADAAGEIILLWEGATIPDGWTCISCSAGDAFLGVFPRASSTPGSASTSANIVNHSLTFSTSTAASLTTSTGETTGASVPDNLHNHSWANTTTSQNSIIPLYRGLKFISAATTTLPNGAIAIFDVASSSLPANWIYASTTENRYLMGSSTIGNDGSATHIHDLSNWPTVFFSGSASNKTADTANTSPAVNEPGHQHPLATSSALAADNNRPPYIGVVFGQLTATSTIPSGMIAMFDNASLPANWSQISTSGSAYAGNLLYGTSTFGSTGGSSTHNHSGSVTWTSDIYAADIVRKVKVATSTTNNNVGTTNHTHNATFNVSSENSMPVYRDVVLAKYTAPAGNSVSNVVLNGGNAITLIANTTTAVSVVASTTGSNFNYATATISRSGVGFSCTADNLNCYQIPSSSCSFSGASSSTVTCSASIYYFAQATDPSSSFAAQNWQGQITLTDTTPTSTSSSTATGVELNTLLAINITTSSVSYGTISPSSTTGLVNQIVSIQDVGNSSTSIQVSGTALAKGSDTIATSSQHYASSTFSFGGSEGILSGTATTISGITLNPHTTNTTNTVSAWTDTTALPSTISEAVAVAYNGYLYNFGGFNVTDIAVTSTVKYAQINSDGTVGSWANTQALLYPLYEQAVATYNGYVYMIGGNAGGAPTTTVRYAQFQSSGTIGSWTNTTALPTRLKLLVAAAGTNGYLYVTGGNDGTSDTSTVSYAKINSDGTIGSWSNTSALPGVSEYHQAVINKGFIYNIPSFYNSAVGATSTVIYAALNSDGTIGSWTNTTALPLKLFKQKTVVMGDYIYNIAGKENLTDTGTPTQTVRVGTIASDGTISAWDAATNLPTGLQYHAATTWNGYIYVLGGLKTTALGSETSTVRYGTVSNGNSQKDTFWGVGPSAGASTGTYQGTTTFTAVFVP